MRKNFRVLLLVLALALVLCACAVPDSLTDSPSPETPAGDELTVHFLDVGQADCILLTCGGESMLIDGGNVDDGSTVVAYLQDEGISTLDYVVCTHAHEDHVGGLAAVLAAFPAEAVWCPVTDFDTKAFRNFRMYAEEQGCRLVMPELDGVYALGGATVTVLGPREAYDDPNNTSIVLRVCLGDCAFVFSGDAEWQSEAAILDAGCDVSCGVLKAGHHGSSTSNSYRWLLEADPQAMVISCGKNNDYGHPHEEVMSRLADAEIDVLRTDMQGHIVCVCDGESYVFYTQYTADAPTNPIEKYTGVYIGNVNSNKYHRETCSGLPREENRVYFDTKAEAEAAGYSPCGQCHP